MLNMRKFPYLLLASGHVCFLNLRVRSSCYQWCDAWGKLHLLNSQSALYKTNSALHGGLGVWKVIFTHGHANLFLRFHIP